MSEINKFNFNCITKHVTSSRKSSSSSPFSSIFPKRNPVRVAVALRDSSSQWTSLCSSISWSCSMSLSISFFISLCLLKWVEFTLKHAISHYCIVNRKLWKQKLNFLWHWNFPDKNCLHIVELIMASNTMKIYQTVHICSVDSVSFTNPEEQERSQLQKHKFIWYVYCHMFTTYSLPTLHICKLEGN